jgi:hypothetical protein
VTQNTSPRQDDDVATRRLAETFSAETIDALIKDAKATGTPLDGVGGLLNQMTKAVLERALQSEMVDHLGYDSGDPAGHGSGNSRNGRTKKTVATANGPIELEVPRDRNSSFEPVIVPKRARRIGNQQHGRLVNNASDNGPEISATIPRGRSKGITNMQVYCFDARSGGGVSVIGRVPAGGSPAVGEIGYQSPSARQ